jgi:hypothetical protein
VKTFRAVAATLSLLLLPFAAMASTYLDQEASWWNSLSAGEKLVAVAAGLDAYEAGYDGGQMDAVISAPPKTGLSKVVLDGLRALHPTFSHTFGFYSSAITDFYVTHPTAAKVTVGAIIGCLADKPNVSCDSLAKYAPQ